MPSVVLNGTSLQLPDAPTLVDALNAVGVQLPAMCHDDRIGPSANCRLCLVRIKGLEREVPACGTRAAEGMEIDTSSPDLEAARRGILEMLAARYPADALSSDPDKPFHRALTAHGAVRDLLSAEMTDPSLVDRSYPYIAIDMNRCIYCTRCVRICAELQGQFVWHIRERGRELRIVPDGPNMLTSSCVSCGACVDSCPTGALEDATIEARGVPVRIEKVQP